MCVVIWYFRPRQLIEESISTESRIRCSFTLLSAENGESFGVKQGLHYGVYWVGWVRRGRSGRNMRKILTSTG